MQPADGCAEQNARTPSAARKKLATARTIVLALLGTLLLAGSAHGAEPAGEQPAGGGTPGASGETTPDPGGTGSGATEGSEKETAITPPAPELTQGQTPAGTAGAEAPTPQPVPEPQAPASEPPPAVTPTPESPTSGQPAAGTPAPAPPVATLPAPESTPAPVKPTVPETPVVTAHAPEAPTPTEQHAEPAQTGAASEDGSKGSPTSPSSGTPPGGNLLSSSSAENAPPAQIAIGATPANQPSEGSTVPPLVTGGRGGGGSTAAARSAAFGSGPLGCALLGSTMSGVCPVSRSTQALISPSMLDAPAARATLATTETSARGGEAHNGSAVATPPISPMPDSQPSGVAGAAAAGGSGGLALSGFLSLAGLLLLAAPRATRRLRLQCRPWRAACFALIPERPG